MEDYKTQGTSSFILSVSPTALDHPSCLSILTHIVDQDVQCMIRFGLKLDGEKIRQENDRILLKSGGGSPIQGPRLTWKKVKSISKFVGGTWLGSSHWNFGCDWRFQFSSKICFVVKHLLMESWKWNLGISEWISFSAQPFLGASPWSRQTRAGAGDDVDNDNHHHNYHYNHEND